MSDLILVAVTGVSSALAGAGVWGFLSTRLNIGVQREQGEIDRLREDIAEAKREAAEAKEHHKACEERVDEMERRLEAIEHHHHSYMARWIKDAGKRIVWINSPGLIALFAPLGYSRNEVIGRTFAELLDPDAAREVDRLDRYALARPGRAVSTMVTLDPRLPPMIVIKVAGAGSDGELKYEGYAYCPNDPEDDLDRGARRQEEQIGASILRVTGQDRGEAGHPPA